jgi:hypothetical protein
MNCTKRLTDAGMSLYFKESIYIIRRWKDLFYLHKHTKYFLRCLTERFEKNLLGKGHRTKSCN